MQPCDTFYFTYAQNGWVNKVFEVDSVKFQVSEGEGGDAPTIRVEFGVIEADPNVYAWNASEELTIYDLANIPAQTTFIPSPPTSVTVTTSAAVAITGLDGVVRPRMEVQWTTPLDTMTTQIQVQYQLAGSGTVWTDGAIVDSSLNTAYIAGVVAGATYNVRVRGIRANGATSAWAEVDGNVVSSTYSQVASLGINPNSPYNVSNNATVDSIVESGTATIRIYGPGGDGTSFTRYVGSTSSTLSAAHITGNAFTTVYYIVYDTVALMYYAFTSYSSILVDTYAFIGTVQTCLSSYTGTGGGTGGGGVGGGGGSTGGGSDGGAGGRDAGVYSTV